MKEAWGMIGGDLLVSERCQSNNHGPGRKLSIKRFKTVPSVSGKVALMSVRASSTGWYNGSPWVWNLHMSIWLAFKVDRLSWAKSEPKIYSAY